MVALASHSASSIMYLKSCMSVKTRVSLRKGPRVAAYHV